MIQQIVEQAKALIASKMNIVETAEEWDLLLEEIRGIDEWVQLSRYYAPAVKSDIVRSEPDEDVTFDQPIVPPVQISSILKPRYAYTFVRELKGGSVREWPNSHISESEIRQWNLEHGMEIRVQIMH